MDDLEDLIDLDLEENIINEYWKTLERKNISNVITNKFIKKPYLENYIIKLSVILDNTILHEKIEELIDRNKIDSEDLFLIVKNNIELEKEEKKNIQQYFLNLNLEENSLDIDRKEFLFELIKYQIDYFRFYQIIVELLFEKEEINELYNYIFIYIKNKKNRIKYFKNKNFKFKLFYYYLNNLSENYHKLYNLLIKLQLINIKEDTILQHLFLKNVFNNWYNIYKKDILENNFYKKMKDYSIPRSILARILCLPSI